MMSRLSGDVVQATSEQRNALCLAARRLPPDLETAILLFCSLQDLGALSESSRGLQQAVVRALRLVSSATCVFDRVPCDDDDDVAANAVQSEWARSRCSPHLWALDFGVRVRALARILASRDFERMLARSAKVNEHRDKDHKIKDKRIKEHGDKEHRRVRDRATAQGLRLLVLSPAHRLKELVASGNRWTSPCVPFAGLLLAVITKSSATLERARFQSQENWLGADPELALALARCPQLRELDLSLLTSMDAANRATEQLAETQAAAATTDTRRLLRVGLIGATALDRVLSLARVQSLHFECPVFPYRSDDWNEEAHALTEQAQARFADFTASLEATASALIACTVRYGFGPWTETNAVLHCTAQVC